MFKTLNSIKTFKMSTPFDEICKEVIILSDIIQKQDFRDCFIKHFTVKVDELITSLPKNLDLKILQRLQCRLLEPLKIHLTKTKNSSQKVVLVDGLSKLLKITLVSNVSEFFDLYTLAFFQIFSEGNLKYTPSEELKISVLEFGVLLLEDSTQELKESIYSEENGAKLSMGISIAVNLVKEERSIQVRLKALDFLLTASKYSEKVIYNVGIYKKVGDLFALYLPGILGPLLEVVLRDETQHHLITAKALQCWGHVLCLVMTDSPQSQKLSNDEIFKQWLAKSQQTTDKVLDVGKILKGNKRTDLWLEAAAVAIQPLLVKITEVRKHSHVKCRLALTIVMKNLLRHCGTNLKTSLSPVIEVLVSSAVDEDVKVQKEAKVALEEFEAEFRQRNDNSFISVIEENMYSLIYNLPRRIQSEDDKLTLPLLKSLSGYLKILGRANRLGQLISLSSTLKKLVSVVVMSFELEMYPEIFRQDISIQDEESITSTWSKQWKRFRHFADDSIQKQLEEICWVIGKYSRAEVLFDFLLDSYNQECSCKNELLIFMNEALLGCSEIPDHVVRQLLDFFLNPSNLYFGLQVDEVNGITLKDAQSNIVRVALIMEGIGKLARSLGAKFEDHLLSTLYYVVEGMGSNYAIIREAGKKSGFEIAMACGLDGNVNSLIKANVDYLTYHLTIKLKRNHYGVFDVITVLMKNSPLETMPNLEEIIISVLKSSSQKLDSPLTISYLRLFQIFALCVKKWTKTTEFSNPIKNESNSEVADLLTFLNSCTKEPDEEEEEEKQVEVKNEDDEEPQLPPEPETPELPRHIKTILAVANHSLHYLASPDKGKKLLAIEILNEIVWILADRENELLPLVHKIWSPLVTRFDRISDYLIINRSFTLLCSLAQTSKQFIRSRTLKNVLPALQSFLLKEAPKSKLKDSSSSYFFTQSFKLQSTLLENLGQLTSSLELFERQTDLVLESALPYLSSSQPHQLQEKCVKLFCHIKVYDPFLVWFKVHQLAEVSEFGANVKLILQTSESTVE